GRRRRQPGRPKPRARPREAALPRRRSGLCEPRRRPGLLQHPEGLREAVLRPMSVPACILGCSTTRLTDEERAFFAEVRPWGFILFKRNIDSPDQVRRLVDDLRSCVGRDDAPVLIDQEGGRVQRMGPPHWRRYPPGRAYGEIASNDPLYRREIARLGARLLAHDLRAVGINVDCVPVLDVPAPDG